MTATRFAPTAARLGASAAWACLLVMVTMVAVAGALTPGYSQVTQFISELGARGAPQEGAVRWAGFLPAGLLLLAFCGCALVALPRSAATVAGLIGLAVYAGGYVVAALFPCDPGCRPTQPSASQLIHNAAGQLGYLLAPVSLLVLARTARGWPDSGRLVRAGYLAAALALIGLFTLSPGSATAGLSQRLLELAVLAWAVCCGRYAARQATGGR